MIVVINSGSSSIKFAAYAGGPGRETAAGCLLKGEIEDLGSLARLHARDPEGRPMQDETWLARVSSPNGHAEAMRKLLKWLKEHLPARHLHAVSHRVVHGGQRFTQPQRISPAVLAELESLIPLAPLHQPQNLAAIRAIAAQDPLLPQFACFDTAFHAGQDWAMQAYALPRQLRNRGVRRYGFHGLSYEYIASVLPQHLGEQADDRVIVAHLGSGASLCAMRERKSVASTMGFSALDGLMMSTRCGHIDPGVVLYMITVLGMQPHQVESMLYRDSGLLGISGLSGDMRELEASTDPRAKAAITLYLRQFARELGSMAAMLGGVDALVFTGGVGEHSAGIRRGACEDATWLGVEIDAVANQAQPKAPSGINSAGSRVSAWVIPADEEIMLARHAQALMNSAGLG